VTAAMAKLKRRAHKWKILERKRACDSWSMEAAADEYIIDTESESSVTI